MAKNNKNAIKTAKKQTKTAEETKVEETKVEEPTPAPVEEKKEEIASPNGEVINPEVVEEAKVEKPKPATQVVNTSKATSLGAALSSAGGSTDRIDKNHAIDLAKMVYQEYVNNPDTPSSIRQTAKKQFDVMTGVALLQYFTQLEEDFENLGVRIKPHMREQAENVLTNYLGVKVKTTAQDDGQLLLQFEEIPTETRKTAAQDKCKVFLHQIPVFAQIADALIHWQTPLILENFLANQLFNAIATTLVCVSQLCRCSYADF